MTRVILLLILLLSLTLASPTLLADVPVSIDTDGDGIENNQDADDDGDGVADEADFDTTNFFLRKDTDCDGLGDYYDTDKDNDGVVDSERLQIVRRGTTGGNSGSRLNLAAPVPDGELLLDFRIVASGWEHEWNTGALEWGENGIEIQPWIDEVLRLIEEKGNVDS